MCNSHTSLSIYRLVPKDGPDFEVVADPSQLKPKDDDKAESSAANGMNYFAARVFRFYLTMS